MDVGAVSGQEVLHVGPEPAQVHLTVEPEVVGQGEQPRALDTLAEHVE